MITLTDAWMRPPKRRAILSSTLKRCVDHDPNRASRWTWRTLRANGVRSLSVACLKCRRATVVNVDVYSITSSAPTRIEIGKVTPSVLAVFMLIVSVNLVAR